MKRKETEMVVSLLLMVAFTVLPVFIKDPGIQWDFGLMAGLSFGIFVKYGDKIDE